ncbi:MAG: SIMPL domain-containing protein [Candidatus Kerfeldbacteria bacterium]|nr:SIMPL domain-containing protein [Candidatus Kerfeldbacteria bacterium]
MTLVGMVLLAGIVVVAILRDRIVNQPQWQVQVTGQGKVSYQPDIANVTVGVQVDKSYSAEVALKQLNDKVNKILAALKITGIGAEDIQTQNYSLYPQYDYRDNVSTLAGYSANQQLVIKVKGLASGNDDKVGKVVAEATKAGANQVTSLTFDASNIDDLKQEARLQAIADAKSKAGSLARATGVDLGDIVGWWENFVQAPGTPLYGGVGGEAKGAGMSPQVPSGSQEVVVEVNLSYKIK